jgi:hypothetical protein
MPGGAAPFGPAAAAPRGPPANEAFVFELLPDAIADAPNAIAASAAIPAAALRIDPVIGDLPVEFMPKTVAPRAGRPARGR